MSEGFKPTRRTFLVQMAWGTVTLVVTPVSLLSRAAEAAPPGGPQPGGGEEGWSGPPGTARYRIDGLAKVTGQKIYARDFRARDMAGWPQEERMAMALRATHVDRPYLGYDLSMLPAELQPEKVVDQATLSASGVVEIYPDTSPAGRPPGFMAAQGTIPVYFGQPVALLIFKDAATYRQAYRRLQFHPAVVKYGPPYEQPPMTTPYSPATYLTRYVDAQGKETFSQTKDGPSNPYEPDDRQQPANQEAARWRKVIQDEIQGSGWTLFRSRCSTQVIDPMFMEPESGLAWYDAKASGGPVLHLVLGTQSTNGDIEDALDLLGCGFKPTLVNLTSCYPGGGFGGRDTSPMLILMALAAVYSQGPVRMANDRYTQFQGGIKQLGAEVEQTIAFDARGKIQAVHAVQKLMAGGKNNYSQFVAELAGYCAGGGYDIPRVAVDATAQPTPGVVAGSMRGFGGPQAAFALETLIDEAALGLGRDAIELRRINAVHEGGRTVTGAPLTEPMRIVEICERAAANPLWKNRKEEKRRRSTPDHLYGVGFALANQAYGTGKDPVMAAVEISPEGKITVTTNCVDMGNGSATTLAIATAPSLGANAEAIRMGEAAFFAPLQPASAPSPGPTVAAPRLPRTLLRERLSGRRSSLSKQVPAPPNDPWTDPAYTPSFSLSSSACITAFHQVHVARQASAVLFRTGLWPAACALWGIDPAGDGWKEARWEEGRLTAPGRPPLPAREIAARLHSGGGVAGAMVHGYYSALWVSADYTVGAVTGRWPIDLLATRQAGSEAWTFQPRSNVLPPPPNSQYYGRSLFSPSATLAAVEVDRRSGRVAVTDLVTYLDAGTVRQPDLLSGQFQGGTAMGVGYALLEDLPLGLGGAGEGNWNLDRYHVALAGDLPLRRMTLELLPPLSPDAPGKGIAEAVLCPVAPAIANAVADATGHRFRSIPITPAQVREALHQGGSRHA